MYKVIIIIEVTFKYTLYNQSAFKYGCSYFACAIYPMVQFQWGYIPSR